MLTWFKNRAVRAAKKRFDAGYSHAAAALLQGVTIEALEMQIEGAQFFGDENEFEDGMEAAIAAYCTLVPSAQPLFFPSLVEA
jgi:hypothetical protein